MHVWHVFVMRLLHAYYMVLHQTVTCITCILYYVNVIRILHVDFCIMYILFIYYCFFLYVLYAWYMYNMNGLFILYAYHMYISSYKSHIDIICLCHRYHMYVSCLSCKCFTYITCLSYWCITNIISKLYVHLRITDIIRIHSWRRSDFKIFGTRDLSVSEIDLLSEGDSIYSRENLFEFLRTPEKTCLICTGTPVKTCWKFWQS